MDDISNRTYEACEELIKIIKENYVCDPQFKCEFISAISKKSGNDKFRGLCENIIECLNKKV